MTDCGRKIGPYDCCTVVCGDCLKLMQVLPDGCVDGVITDPPYGISVSLTSRGMWGGSEIIGDSDLSCRDTAMHFFGGSWIVFNSPKSHRPIGTEFVLIWNKGEHVGMGNLRFPWKLTHEEICLHGSEFRSDFRDGSVLYFPAVAGCVGNRNDGHRFHPVEKPIELMEYLVNHSTAQTILDPFLGSGTTAVAAKKLGRHFLGFEIEQKYVDIANDRIALVQAQPSLYAPKPEQLDLVVPTGS